MKKRNEVVVAILLGLLTVTAALAVAEKTDKQVRIEATVMEMPLAELNKMDWLLTDAGRPAAFAPTDLLTVATVLSKAALVTVRKSLQSSTVNAKVLHTASLETADQKEAIGKQGGEDIHYMEKRADGLYELKSMVGPGFVICALPRIKDNGMIDLTLTVELRGPYERRSLPEAPNLDVGLPFMRTRSVSTTISIYDGATVVMGVMAPRREGEKLYVLFLVTAGIME